MCEWCGCGQPNDSYHEHSHEHNHSDTSKIVELNKSILEENNRIALKNKEHIEALGAVGINFISSPGSGKTTLLQETIKRLKPRIKVGVIEGDIETQRDAQRIREQKVPVVQLTTGGACHLDARLVHKGIHQLEHELDDKVLDFLFIENVGNLVCPASFYLGEHKRVVLVSVPEGSDKPAKYPKAFMEADLFIISKIDLLDYFDFSIDEAKEEALKLNPRLDIICLSSVTGEGMDEWINYLLRLIKKDE